MGSIESTEQNKNEYDRRKTKNDCDDADLATFIVVNERNRFLLSRIRHPLCMDRRNIHGSVPFTHTHTLVHKNITHKDDETRLVNNKTMEGVSD